ncbi:chitin synthase [Marasmius fiardii PR-910]|nr:chitin synthase [Marasmius fiardii PR-910]
MASGYYTLGDVDAPDHSRTRQASLVYPPPTLNPFTSGDEHLHLNPYYPPSPSTSSFQDDDDPEKSYHESTSIEGQWRRRQTIKRGVTRKVKLTQGHFITEYPVPTPIFSATEPSYRDSSSTTEFTHMRYTAATCDPDDFTEANGWSLRTKNYGRSTEILIAVTSYNEDKTLYARTLHGVMINIRDMCKTKKSKFWKSHASAPSDDLEIGGPSGGVNWAWQKITVALIVDGLESMDKSVLDILATVGVYQDGVMKKRVDGKDVVAHVFETVLLTFPPQYTTQLSISDSASNPQLDNLVPVQIILVLKAKNQKKINSHRWLFNAIGRMLQPEVCVLIDAGTKPGRKSIFYLWEAFANNKNLGGCCGEIHAMIKGGKKLLNPLVAAQNFEYKMSNILDKPLESSFGYVSVLPGAFSAYRFRAILGRPLEQYFHGDHSLADRLGDKGIYGMGIFTKNMFLAEDRILCFELVTKKGACWTLTYVKPSKAETDVPESAAELIGQRRRWLNGSFAASVYALVNFFQIYRSGHGPIRMSVLTVQALYNAVSLVFSWFALANMWLTFAIIIDLLPDMKVDPIVIFGTVEVTHWVNAAFKWIYVTFLVLQFVLALGNRPKGERPAYAVTLWVYAILSLYLLICAFWLTFQTLLNIPHLYRTAKLENNGSFDLVKFLLDSSAGALAAALFSTYGIYFIGSLIYGDPWHMFSSFFQYLLLAPSFTNVLNVYAFCNLHDVSWGTKGSDKEDALPSIKSSKAQVVEDTTKPQEDVDEAFKLTVKRAIKPVVVEEVVEKPTMDDQNRTFRTRLVACWMFSNAVLAIGVMNIDGVRLSGEDQKDLVKKQSFYFNVILFSTLGLSAVRFVGCVFYFVKRNLFRVFQRT